jgi:hypothetical protein
MQENLEFGPLAHLTGRAAWERGAGMWGGKGRSGMARTPGSRSTARARPGRDWVCSSQSEHRARKAMTLHILQIKIMDQITMRQTQSIDCHAENFLTCLGKGDRRITRGITQKAHAKL